MEYLPGDTRLDAELVVEHLRAILAGHAAEAPRQWSPQATFDELMRKMNREPIHLHPAIHHLHHYWNMEALGPPPAGRGPKARVKRFVHRYLEHALGTYFRQELEYRAALAQSIDALAYRIDEVTSADERNLLELVLADLFDLARHVEASCERLGASLESR